MDDPVDRVGRIAAKALASDVESRVDTDDALRRLTGSDVTNVVLGDVRPRRTRPLALVAGVAVIAAGVGAALVVATREPHDAVRPSTNVSAPPDFSTPPTAGLPTEPSPDDSVPLPSATLSPTTLPAAPDTEVEPAPAAVDATTTVAEDDSGALAVVHQCATDGACTQLVTLGEGTLVAFDPVDHTLTRLDATGADVLDVIEVDDAIHDRRPRLVAGGPDGVSYFLVASTGTSDPFVDLVAIPTTGARAGSAIEVATRLDGSGDTDLVPTTEGLAEVACCGTPGASILPSPDAMVHRWVGSAGSTTTSDTPTFTIGLGENAGLTRSDPATGSGTHFVLPAVAAGARGVPPVVPTDAGGAVMLVVDQLSGRRYAIRFRPDWPEFDIDPSDVVLLPEEAQSSIVLVEASGTVIVGEGGRLVRRTLENVGEAGWAGSVQTDPTDPWTTTAPGLNDVIASNQPEWATDPLLLGRQLQPRLGPNEHRTAIWNETSGVLTITTTGFLDDSVFATRDEVVLELAADGLYRFVSAQRAQQCQPERGHQDFRQELCT